MFFLNDSDSIDSFNYWYLCVRSQCLSEIHNSIIIALMKIKISGFEDTLEYSSDCENLSGC